MPCIKELIEKPEGLITLLRGEGAALRKGYTRGPGGGRTWGTPPRLLWKSLTPPQALNFSPVDRATPVARIGHNRLQGPQRGSRQGEISFRESATVTPPSYRLRCGVEQTRDLLNADDCWDLIALLNLVAIGQARLVGSETLGGDPPAPAYFEALYGREQPVGVPGDHDVGAWKRSIRLPLL
jgi:hypothetical protein